MNNSLIIYSKKDCVGCMLTKRFLSEQGVLFEDRSLTGNENHLKELEQMGYKTLPIILFPNQEIWVFAGQASLEILQKKLINHKLL